MKKYEVIILDLDNTLLDSKSTENEALPIIFEKYNLPTDSKTICMYKKINDKLRDDFNRGVISRECIDNKRFELLFEKFGKKVCGEKIDQEFKSILKTKSIPANGMYECLEYLKKEKYRLFLATNGMSDIQRSKINNLKISPYFEDIFISGEVGHRKPSIEFFEYMLKKITNFNREKTLMVGDGLHSDIKGANTAKIDSCWINLNNISNTEIEPTYIINTLLELSNLLE